jgi:hypothetical protein
MKRRMIKTPLIPLYQRGKDGTGTAGTAFANHTLPFKREIERDLEAVHFSLPANMRGMI